MSASLVGSEMCIRDRIRSRAAVKGQRQRGSGASSSVRRLWAALSCFKPVSYTHLTLPTICSV
eukprot:13261979-Alexandrium_andersonii.AAC.1